MKKVDFLDLVCAELARMGVGDAEIKIQIQSMDRYLTSMGIGEESPSLDGENPAAFAQLIYGNVAKKQGVTHPVVSELQTADVIDVTDDFAEEMPKVEAVEADEVLETGVAVEEGVTVEAVKAVEEFHTYVPDVQLDSEVPAAGIEEDDVKIFVGSYVDEESVPEEIFANAPQESIFEDVFEQSIPEPMVFEENVQDALDTGSMDTEYAPTYVYEGTPVDEQYGYGVDYVEYAPAEIEAVEESYYEETSTEYVFAPQDSNGTIEFDVSKLKQKKEPSKKGELEAEDDYFEKEDEDEYVPSGNPALFWVLVALTSFLWIPLLFAFTLAVGMGFVLMLIFEVLYVPSIVVIIIGGSAVSFAELIYSIVKFVGKNPAIALFELGLGLLVAALTFGLPAAMYYLGVSVFPKWIKNYGRNVKRLFRKLRRIYRKLKGVCSI